MRQSPAKSEIICRVVEWQPAFRLVIFSQPSQAFELAPTVRRGLFRQIWYRVNKTTGQVWPASGNDVL